MGSADEVNIQASELNRTMKVADASPGTVAHDSNKHVHICSICCKHMLQTRR